MRPLRIAILAHSTNPRGGVVHALELGDALHGARSRGRGARARCQPARLLPPDARARPCASPAPPVGRDVTDMVATRVTDYLAHFARPAPRVRRLARAGRDQRQCAGDPGSAAWIGGFTRTVHHVDTLRRPAADARCSSAASRAADQVLCVSRTWLRASAAPSTAAGLQLVGNGVDRERFSPDATTRRRLREQLGLAAGTRLPRGRRRRGAQEHAAPCWMPSRSSANNGRWRSWSSPAAPPARPRRPIGRQFAGRAARQAGCRPESVIRTGPLPDADMPALYRACATRWCFRRSTRASASSCWRRWRAARRSWSRASPRSPNTSAPDDVCWCDPHDPVSIAGAMRAACSTRAAAASDRQRVAVAARHDWTRTAARLICRLTRTCGRPPCLRCTSASAGPTAASRAAIRRRW